MSKLYGNDVDFTLLNVSTSFRHRFNVVMTSVPSILFHRVKHRRTVGYRTSASPIRRTPFSFLLIAAQLLQEAVVLHRAGWSRRHVLGHGRRRAALTARRQEVRDVPRHLREYVLPSHTVLLRNSGKTTQPDMIHRKRYRVENNSNIRVEVETTFPSFRPE